MDNIYTKLRKRLEETGDGQLLVTCLSHEDQGYVRDCQRSLDEGAFLSEEENREVLLLGRPVCFPKEGCLIFAEPFYKKERIIILGGGHVAVPLVKFAKIVGFYVVVIDDRPQFANSRRFPEADEIICEAFPEGIKTIKPVKSDYYVIITRGHKHDSLCIRELMKYEESVYTGLIGSRKRTAIVMDNLTEEGYDRERLMRICTPIGLAIGALTTEEIGISIIAEIIKRKRLESKGNTAVNRSDGDDRVIDELAALNKPCCLITIMETEGSVPRSAGAKMIVYEDTSICGSIGGGCVEAEVIHKAIRMIGSGKYEILTIHLNNEDAMAEGMVCGGSLRVLLEDFS